MPPTAVHYPFTAVVGSDDMALALVLTTISPSVGGVLVRGEKGTAKSTMVRALAAVLPPIDVVAGDRFSTAAAARPVRADGRGRGAPGPGASGRGGPAAACVRRRPCCLLRVVRRGGARADRPDPGRAEARRRGRALR